MTNDRQSLARDFLDAHHVMSLALGGADGVHACSLMYAASGFTLYWVSAPESRHSRLIEAAGAAAAAVTVAPDYDDFRHIRGLQMHGSAARVTELGETARALAQLGRRYSFLAAAGGAVGAALSKAAVYRFRPSTVTFIDNGLGFGHKDTFAC